MFNSAVALFLIDLQNDFLPGGALPVFKGDQIIPLANQLQPYFHRIIATQDWHPLNHISFASNHPQKAVGDTVQVGDQLQRLWPIHCVQHSWGAQFHPMLATHRIHKIIRKGTRPEIDSYSAFFDHDHTANLASDLVNQAIQCIYIMGLALDYCVQYSALDAVKLGFNTVIILDACRSISHQSNVIETMLNKMRACGIQLTTTTRLLNEIQSD